MCIRDRRSYYEELLRAGVRIWMFRPPYILHSKHFTVDGAAAVVGSSNMDQRSFGLNMEISMIVHGESFVRDLDGHKIEAAFWDEDLAKKLGMA